MSCRCRFFLPGTPGNRVAQQLDHYEGLTSQWQAHNTELLINYYTQAHGIAANLPLFPEPPVLFTDEYSSDEEWSEDEEEAYGLLDFLRDHGHDPEAYFEPEPDFGSGSVPPAA